MQHQLDRVDLLSKSCRFALRSWGIFGGRDFYELLAPEGQEAEDRDEAGVAFRYCKTMSQSALGGLGGLQRRVAVDHRAGVVNRPAPDI